MAAGMDQPSTSARLRCGIVLGVKEDACEIIGEGARRSVRYATLFPSPRIERVSPGHLEGTVALSDPANVSPQILRPSGTQPRPGGLLVPTSTT